MKPVCLSQSSQKCNDGAYCEPAASSSGSNQNMQLQNIKLEYIYIYIYIYTYSNIRQTSAIH